MHSDIGWLSYWIVAVWLTNDVKWEGKDLTGILIRGYNYDDVINKYVQTLQVLSMFCLYSKNKLLILHRVSVHSGSGGGNKGQQALWHHLLSWHWVYRWEHPVTNARKSVLWTITSALISFVCLSVQCILRTHCWQCGVMAGREEDKVSLRCWRKSLTPGRSTDWCNPTSMTCVLSLLMSDCI